MLGENERNFCIRNKDSDNYEVWASRFKGYKTTQPFWTEKKIEKVRKEMLERVKAIIVNTLRGGPARMRAYKVDSIDKMNPRKRTLFENAVQKIADQHIDKLVTIDSSDYDTSVPSNVSEDKRMSVK